MKIDILTLFPEMFTGPFEQSIVNRAQERKFVTINVHNLRKWAIDKRGTVDDHPYGGGAGMLLRVEPVYDALKELKSRKSKVILLSAKGETYKQQMAQDLSKEKHLIFLAGHYEGFDQRVHDHLVDFEISIGNYVLTGGELPTMVIVDSVVRLLPGVLGNPSSLEHESHTQENVVEYPQYTRPEKFKKWKVPEILLSGDHVKIEKWNQEHMTEIPNSKK